MPIAGLRDILIHQYFGIDVEIIWDVVRNKLPTLDDQVRRMLDEWRRACEGVTRAAAPLERSQGVPGHADRQRMSLRRCTRMVLSG